MDGETQTEDDYVSHAKLCVLFVSTHLISHPLLTDLADSNRHSLAFKDEITYLYQS